MASINSQGSISDDGLERFSPLILHNILVSVRRFEPDFYAHICRAFHLDADRIVGLFSDIEFLGGGQLMQILALLREHQAYHDIVYLAGRNTLHMYVEKKNLKLGRGSGKYQGLVKQILPNFLGQSKLTMMIRGDIHYIELSDSVFSRDIHHANPLCGFYSGFLSELGQTLTGNNCIVTEVRCRSVDTDSTSCLIQASL